MSGSRERPPHRAGNVSTSESRPRSTAQLAAIESACERQGTTWILIAIALHAALFSAIGWIKFRYFLFRDFDLAIFAQALDQLLRGSLFVSIRGMNWPGDHSSLILFPIAPLYALARHPLTLVVLQALGLALGALPVLRLARRASGSAAVGVVCAALFLAHPALGYIDLFEFHPEALALTPLLLVFEELEAGRARTAWLWAALAALAREDVALVLAALGVYALVRWRRERTTIAVGLFAIAAASLLVTFLWLRPTYGSGAADYTKMYRGFGATPVDMIRMLLTHPWRGAIALLATAGDPADTALKGYFHLNLLLPLALLPLLAPLELGIALPILAEHFLSSRPAQHSIVFQYTALILPWVMIAAIRGWTRVARWLGAGGRAQLAIGAAALLASLASNLLFGSLVGTGRLQLIARPESIWPTGEDRTLAPFRHAMLTRVSKDAGVIAGMELLLPLCGRSDVHAMHHFLSGHYTFSSQPYRVPQNIGAVMADLGDGALVENVNVGTGARWRQLIAENHLSPVASANDNLLLLRDARDTLDLIGAADRAPQRAQRVLYDGQLEYLGSDSLGDAAAGGVLSLATYWRRTGAVDRLFLTEIVCIDEQHENANQLWRYLGYTIAPVADWVDSVAMRERYRLVIAGDMAPGRYQLVVRPWGRGARLAVSVADDPTIRKDEGWVSLGFFHVSPPRNSP